MEALYKYICMRTNLGILRINMKVVQMKISINPKKKYFYPTILNSP